MTYAIISNKILKVSINYLNRGLAHSINKCRKQNKITQIASNSLSSENKPPPTHLPWTRLQSHAMPSHSIWKTKQGCQSKQSSTLAQGQLSPGQLPNPKLTFCLHPFDFPLYYNLSSIQLRRHGVSLLQVLSQGFPSALLEL